MKLLALLAGAAVAVFAVPAFGSFWTFVATLAVIYALLGMSLVVLTGWTGQLNLHVAALGLGWGAYACFALISVGASSVVALVAAPVLTIPFSLIVGGAAVRFRGLELAVATLAIGLAFERLVFRNLGSWLGSSSDTSTPFASSFVPVARPSAFESDHAFYLFVLAAAAIAYVVLWNLSRGHTRRAMLALREREVAAEVAGIPALRYRTGAFVLSIAVAGLAGSLFAALKQGIAPESFDLDLSFLILAGVVIGGVRTLRGGALGGILAAVLPEVVRFGPLKLIAGERLTFLFGAGLVLTLAFRPKGLLALRERRASAAPPVAEPAPSRPRRRRRGARLVTPSALRADGVSIHFGGVQALDNVDLTVPEGEICALIGPNGAGKTTLFNCVSGIAIPDTGRVYLGPDDITDMPPHRRAQLGLGRTFQSVELFAEQTVRENLTVASHIRRAAGPVAEALRLPAARRSNDALEARAADTLGQLEITHLADARPDDLTAADLRRVELASVLIREPRVLLLDEPTAGLSPTESVALAHQIAALRDERGLTILLVEHDMTVVGEIADWVYVLDFGRIIASGTPEQVRRNRLVVDIYLGQHEVRGARSA